MLGLDKHGILITKPINFIGKHVNVFFKFTDDGNNFRVWDYFWGFYESSVNSDMEVWMMINSKTSIIEEEYFNFGGKIYKM